MYNSVSWWSGTLYRYRYHHIIVCSFSQCDNAKHSPNSVGPPCTSEVGLKRIKSLFLDHETNGLLEHSKMNYHDLVGGFNHLKKIWTSMGRMATHILWKIEHVWNHQPVIYYDPLLGRCTFTDVAWFSALSMLNHWNLMCWRCKWVSDMGIFHPRLGRFRDNYDSPVDRAPNLGPLPPDFTIFRQSTWPTIIHPRHKK